MSGRYYDSVWEVFSLARNGYLYVQRQKAPHVFGIMYHLPDRTDTPAEPYIVYAPYMMDGELHRGSVLDSFPRGVQLSMIDLRKSAANTLGDPVAE